MKRLVSIRFLRSFAAVFALVAVGCYFFPRSLIGKAVPVLTFPISIFHPDFKIQTSLNGENEFVLDVFTLEKQEIGHKEQFFRREFKIRHEIGSIFGIPLVFYPLLFTWPGIPVRYRLKGALLILPAMFLIIAVDISLTLLIEIEARIIEPTLRNRVLYYLAQGLNGGGRQFLGLLLFAAVMAPRFLKKPVYTEGSSLERNSPCPCGSGKKYKNCCMH
jgi:hypothetical protein